jgi:hypothetical protein
MSLLPWQREQVPPAFVKSVVRPRISVKGPTSCHAVAVALATQSSHTGCGVCSVTKEWMCFGIVPVDRFIAVHSDQSRGGGLLRSLSLAIHISAAFAVAKPRSVLRAPSSLTTDTSKPTPPSAGHTVYIGMLMA